MKTRDRISSELRNYGFIVTDSKANFIFISNTLYNAKDIFLELRKRGILVRHFSLPRIQEYLRVSIGSDEDMDNFLNAIKDIISRK